LDDSGRKLAGESEEYYVMIGLIIWNFYTGSVFAG
jgi:hypothetical protein